MKNKKGNYKIPLDNRTGHPMTYSSNEAYTEWVENWVFSDILKLKKLKRARSAAHLIFVSLQTDIEFTMFLKDFLDCNEQLNGGILRGQFTFQKRGMNYGIRMILEGYYEKTKI